MEPTGLTTADTRLAPRGMRGLLHGGVLAVADIAGVIAGFTVFYVLRPAPQLAIQVPVAMLLTAAAFTLWSLAAAHLRAARWSLGGPAGFAWTYATAFIWSPIIFVPFHYVTQGYWTTFANLAALWRYQAGANLLALAASAVALRRWGD